jgi:hypothetical protein
MSALPFSLSKNDNRKNDGMQGKICACFFGVLCAYYFALIILPFRKNGEANRGRAHDQLERQIA